MNIEQVGLQLGIAGLLVVVGYTIAIYLVRNWREAEKERTAAIAGGLSAIAGSVQAHVGALAAHAAADIASQGAITDRVARLEGKLDQALRDKRERPSPQIVTPHGGVMIRDPEPG